MNEDKINTLINLLNEKEVLLKDRELALEDQQEEFLAQKEELHAAVEELIAKNTYLANTLDKLQKRNTELDHILYRASHDLKTPVSSIYGLIDILQSAVLNEDQQMAVSHLLRQIQQMDTRLASLTNLSTAFFNEPNLQWCSIKNLIQQTWRSIEPGQEIKLSFITEDVEVVADPGMLTIALKSLLNNCIAYRNFSPGDYVKISCVKKSTTVEIDVTDNGEGIDSNISSHIFDMFYRGSERSKGFGLGLYIVKSIAEKFNGSIQYIPNQTETTFRLTLPV